MGVKPRATGAVRPGGRTARTRAAVLAATQEELEAAGYAGLTLEKVTERSVVHLASSSPCPAATSSSATGSSRPCSPT